MIDEELACSSKLFAGAKLGGSTRVVLKLHGGIRERVHTDRLTKPIVDRHGRSPAIIDASRQN